MNRLESVRALAAEVAADTGVELFDVEFSGSHLRVFIDAPGGTKVADCARFSGLLAQRLDASNLILERYYLEVSSPGLERRLRDIDDFQRSLGRLVRIVTPVGVREGVIRRVDAGQVVLETNGSQGEKQEATIAFADIRRANLKLNKKELFAKPRIAETAGKGNC